MTQDDIIQNDPELNGKFLGEITQDFVKVSDYLKEASYLIRKNGFSGFPIFPMAKSELPIGKLLYGKTELDLDWDYYASYLEEFVESKLVNKERIEAFKQNYKDPDEFCCIFLVDRRMTGFVYIPYPVD